MSSAGKVSGLVALKANVIDGGKHVLLWNYTVLDPKIIKSTFITQVLILKETVEITHENPREAGEPLYTHATTVLNACMHSMLKQKHHDASHWSGCFV